MIILIKSVHIIFLFCFFFQTPIQVFGIEGRYATALYSAASKQNKLEAVEKETKSLQVSYEVCDCNGHFSV